MKWLKALLPLLLLSIAHIAQAADPAPVGRIFFTPEQRAQLDTLRTQKAVALQVRDEPVPENVTYNGIVRRSDGKASVWINSELLSEADLRNKQSIVGHIGRDGRVTLQATQAAVQLKVGQSATLFSGKVDESFTQRPVPDKKKADSKPSSEPATKQSAQDIPPELVEALRQAAAREQGKTGAAITPETRNATDAPRLEGAQKPPPR